jgi:peptidoglycan/xylan/chitin deacetylase (PgdA/CDA1 family)
LLFDNPAVKTLLLLALPAMAFGELASTPISGANMPPRTVILTIDDGPYEKWQSGPNEPPSWTIYIAQYLSSLRLREPERPSIKAVFFLVGCHFRTQPAPPRQYLSNLCSDARDQDPGLIGQLKALGHTVANHGNGHIPASLLSGLPADQRAAILWQELAALQYTLDDHQANDLHLWRPPGGDYPEWAPAFLNQDPYLKKLQGPIGFDVGGGFQVGNNVVAGDIDCFHQNITPESCGDLYLRDTEAATRTHGAIVLFHHDVPPGWYAYRLMRHFVEGLGSKYKIMDIRDHPAFGTMKTPGLPVEPLSGVNRAKGLNRN